MLGIQSVVFGAGELGALECAGKGWEISSRDADEGWVCLAARATDRVGNVGVSTPLRVCVSDRLGSEPACATSSTTPPRCTDGCTLPSKFPSVILNVR
jgi:hypothetical protein